MSDREDQEADEQPRMPAAAQASESPGLPQGGEIFAEPRNRLVRGEGAVREPWRETGLLDERIGQSSRVGGQHKDGPDGTDRDEPQAQAAAGR